MSECYECGITVNLEDHHCVFRSQQKQMIGVSLNKVKLCSNHHRGDHGPHKNRETDLKYKRMFQDKLFKTFDKEFYTQEQIRKLLHTNIKAIEHLTKTLKFYKEGYAQEDIIRACMGGQLYGNE